MIVNWIGLTDNHVFTYYNQLLAHFLCQQRWVGAHEQILLLNPTLPLAIGF